jgi:undecaprenyl-diphosphatase
MNETIKIVASYFILIPVIAVLIVFIRLRASERKSFIIYFAIGAVLSLLLAKIGSHFFSDPRPFVVSHVTPLIAHSNDNGFPSDHTLLSAFIGFALYKYSKKLAAALVVIAVLIGGARVLAHVHHVPDILGSFCFAAIGTAVAFYIVQRYFDKKQVSARPV